MHTQNLKGNHLQETDFVAKLVELLKVLRSEKGCPWDREQTHESLKKYFTEELHEFFDALEEGSDEQIANELGDLLLQIVFHCQIADEAGRFNLQTVAKHIYEKIVRRHPHVFGNIKVGSSEEVRENWDSIKATEKEHLERKSLLDGVPRSLPALEQAERIQQKASKAGFDWSEIEGPLSKIKEEITEIQEALAQNQIEELKEEVGDLLFATVNFSRFMGGDAEHLLKRATDKFKKRFQKLENEFIIKRKINLKESSLEDLDKMWEWAKKQ